jgi:hypothetical protein
MGLLDNLGDLLKQAAAGTAPEADVHAAYDQVATTANHGDITDGLTHAFNSDQTPPFEQMLSGLFANSSADQKAGILNQIMGALGPGGASQMLGAAGGLGGLAGLAGMLSGGNVTPQQAQQVSPEAVQVLAQNAAKKDPSIVNAAAGFYAQHPQLVKAIGAGALALLMSRISQSRR